MQKMENNTMTKVLLTNECMGEYEGLKEVSKEEGEKKY